MTPAPMALIVFGAAALATYLRIYFSVDFADESFHVALPYVFALGNRPYHDEVNIVQNSGLLLLPFVKVYLWAKDSQEGVVLFVRHLYFIYLFFAAMLSYALMKRFISASRALLGAGFILTFTHLAVYTLGHDTFGSLGFLCGALLMAMGTLSERPARLFFAAMLFFTTALFSYPPLLPAAVLVPAGALRVLSRSRAERQRRRSALAGLGAGLAVAFLAAGAVIAYAGIGQLQRMADFLGLLAREGGEGMGNDKFSRILGGLTNNLWILVLCPVALALAAQAPRFLKKFPRAARVLMAVGFATVFVPAQKIVGVFALLAPLALLFPEQRRHPERSLLFLVLWIPAFVGGIITSWSSSNGPTNAALGLLPGLIATVILASRVFDAKVPRGGALFMGLLSVLLLARAANCYLEVYRDGPVPALDTLVREGPYAGLLTTPERAALIGRLGADLEAQAATKQTILVVGDFFSAGYLFTGLRPRAQSVWPLTIIQSWELARDYREPASYPDVVLQKITDFTARDRLAAFFRAKGYRLAVDDKEYRILVKPIP